ncbi:MAG: GntR family transcriptional regulator [Burkholderiaceae bacterium]
MKNQDNASAALPSLPLIDRDSPLPLYEQIKRRLLSMVLNWPDQATRFHSDQELSQMFGVSRMTVRPAMQDLVTEGYLKRVQGVGTFVCHEKVVEQFTPEMDFLNQSASRGRPITLKILHCEKRPAPDHVADTLKLGRDDLVWKVIRLRTAQNVPISIDYRYIIASRIDELSPETLAGGSLLDIVARRVELTHADLRIEAGAVTDHFSDFLSLIPGDPVLTRHLVYYDAAGTPVLCGVSHYRADQVSYSLRVPLHKGPSNRQNTAHALQIREVV